MSKDKNVTRIIGLRDIYFCPYKHITCNILIVSIVGDAPTVE